MTMDEDAIDKINDGATNTPVNTGNGPTPPTMMTAPSAHKQVNPFAHYAEREGDEFFAGDYARIDSETRAWVRGQEKEPIGATEAFVANMHEARHGHIKFKGEGAGVERHTVLIAEQPDLPPCPACGNTTAEHDDKRCSWRPTVYLPMRSVTDPEDVICFTGTGLGARRAMAQLCKIYSRPGADRQGKSPTVLLETRSFENNAGGTTTWPVFKLINWEFFSPGVPAPEAKPVAIAIAPPAPAKATKALPPKRDDLDDAIPF
jgi:hypothetical protein